MGRVSLYYHTVKYLKPSQMMNRLRIKMGKKCSLGVAPSRNYTDIQEIVSPESLDFDPVFLARFPVEELMEDRISILHSSKDMVWNLTWEFEDKTALWNFNLHYFEYLFPLVKAWKDTGEKRYFDKTVQIIDGWIDANPVGRYPGWASYTTALRIVSWVSYYGYVSEVLTKEFKRKFLSSLHRQYVHLAEHLEKDILGNHYFENLKSLVIAAIFFKDDTVLEKAHTNFKEECKEEILHDGMHFELSPMYHSIILEGILRASVTLREVGKQDKEIEAYLQPMLDVAYSFEDGLERIPLFNDGGNNVAKSLEALVITAEQYFGLKPVFRGRLEDSGFYIFVKDINGHKCKLIVDAGQPGPKYIPGHAHCDAMSYELFCDGKPVLVNCGTYAYQCEDRSFFRSTAAHNTVMLEEAEQSQCWGVFRLAKRSTIKVTNISGNSITMEMTDAWGKQSKRRISFSNNSIMVVDESIGAKLDVFVHCYSSLVRILASGEINVIKHQYAPDYGLKEEILCQRISNQDKVTHTITFS